MERREDIPREKKPAPPRQRLVLISGEGDDAVESPDATPLRIVGSEPRFQGGYRLTDR